MVLLPIMNARQRSVIYKKNDNEYIDESKTSPSLNLPTETSEKVTFSHHIEHQAAGLIQQPDVMPASLNDGMEEMRGELKSLRVMIENKQVLGDWQELSSHHPLRVSLYKRLTKMGLSQSVCKYLAKGLDNAVDVDQAMHAALKQLVYQIPVACDAGSFTHPRWSYHGKHPAFK